MSRKIILVFILLICFISPSFADEVLDSDAVILPGSKIKVITKTEKESARRGRTEYQYSEYTGRFLERTDDAFVIQTDYEVFTLDNKVISILYTSNSTKSNFGQGFKYGGIIGFAFGAIAGYAEPFEICIFGPCDPPTTSERFRSGLGFGLGMGIVGGLLGGGVGALIQTEKWEVAQADQFQFSLEPVYDNKVGLNLTLRF